MSKLARKFLIGDIVEDTLGNQLRVTWINHDEGKAGLVKQESAYGKWEGKVKPLAELKLVKPSIHTQRPLTPIEDMSNQEMREHIRLLREGRQEELANEQKTSSSSSSKSSSSSSSSKSTKKEKEIKALKDAYDIPDSTAQLMRKQGEEIICQTVLGCECQGVLDSD